MGATNYGFRWFDTASNVVLTVLYFFVTQYV